ncbi:MAG: hypothetical protein IJM19_04765, partial [Ruminococcus sp.]|nr:hypothetical protein [Ruminococcus sp.]
MKKNLILSLVTTAVMPLSLVSCSNNAEISVEENSKVSETTEITENVSEDITEENTESTEQTEEVSEEQTEIQENADEESDYEEDAEFERVSLDEVNEMAKKLLEDVKISDNKKAVQEDIDKLLEYEDKASDLVSYSALDFNYDWQNEAISEKDDILNEDLVVIDAGLTYAFCNAALSEEYAELFKDLIFDDPESNEVYTVRGNSLRRTEEYARVDFRLSDETLDEYYEILYDENMTDDEKDLKCAELYIDILSGYDPETFYDFYYRDFTPEEATETTELILKELVPAYNELVQKYIELDENDELGN